MPRRRELPATAVAARSCASITPRGGTSYATEPDRPCWPAPRRRCCASLFRDPAASRRPGGIGSLGHASSFRRGCPAVCQVGWRCCRPSPAAPARRDHAVQLQGGADSHPVTGQWTAPDGYHYRGWLPAYLAWLEADREEADRPVILGLGGRLQLHGDPVQTGTTIRLAQHGAVGLGNGAPVGGSGDRMRAADHQALAIRGPLTALAKAEAASGSCGRLEALAAGRAPIMLTATRSPNTSGCELSQPVGRLRADHPVRLPPVVNPWCRPSASSQALAWPVWTLAFAA